jgi:hypothetical protein
MTKITCGMKVDGVSTSKAKGDPRLAPITRLLCVKGLPNEPPSELISKATGDPRDGPDTITLWVNGALKLIS